MILSESLSSGGCCGGCDGDDGGVLIALCLETCTKKRMSRTMAADLLLVPENDMVVENPHKVMLSKWYIHNTLWNFVSLSRKNRYIHKQRYTSREKGVCFSFYIDG